MVVIVMGMTACSSKPKEDAVSANTDSQQKTEQEETADTKTAKTNDVETLEENEIPEGDPIAGIVEEYEGDVITVRTSEDDMLYHFSTENVPILEGFSTENARAAEGDFQIAIGDKVEVSYRGLLDDKKHPIEAVKIVVITVE